MSSRLKQKQGNSIVYNLGGANAKKKSNKKHFDPDRSVPEYKVFLC